MLGSRRPSGDPPRTPGGGSQKDPGGRPVIPIPQDGKMEGHFGEIKPPLWAAELAGWFPLGSHDPRHQTRCGQGSVLSLGVITAPSPVVAPDLPLTSQRLATGSDRPPPQALSGFWTTLLCCMVPHLLLLLLCPPLGPCPAEGTPQVDRVRIRV